LAEYSTYGILNYGVGGRVHTRVRVVVGLLSEDEQVEISAKVLLLEEHGPTLPRPHADVITTSRHSNMKELRARVDQRQLRVLYAFDSRRMALLLIGGDKTGDAKWYESSCRWPTNCSLGTSNGLTGKSERRLLMNHGLSGPAQEQQKCLTTSNLCG
jgi:hypothetical protein